MTSEGTTELVDVKLDITPKGTPYGILKLKGLGDPDTGEPGELFIFSDIFYKALKDKILVKGNNLRIIVEENIILKGLGEPDAGDHLKRVNVKKITKIKQINKEQTL